MVVFSFARNFKKFMVDEMKLLCICRDRPDSSRKLPRKLGFGAVAFIAFMGVFSTSNCFADSVAQDTQSGSVHLASFTGLAALPDSSMALVTGTGLQSPSVTENAVPRGTVTLWDEIRPSNLQQQLNSGTVTITVNGVVQ
jgi:hypothetical protein